MATTRVGGGGLLELDPNLVACVLLHLQPADLAHVGQTCRELAREADADVVWCTLFLRRFGSDFWGEDTPGPHPYTAVPEERNAWLEHGITDLFARFSLASCNPHEKPTADADGDEDDEETDGATESIENRLMEFARSHATAGAAGYGGWKAAYRRMHDMVTEWRKPVTAVYIVAGLPAFSTLDAITDTIKQAVIEGFPGSLFQTLPDACIEADVVSPGGQCRVIRMRFTIRGAWGSPVKRVANVCVIRKPRSWYIEGESAMFRGLELGNEWPEIVPKLIYVVDGERMECSERYQERVYRELHGMLGEGKGRFEAGLGVALYLLNPGALRDTIMDRLKVRPLVLPGLSCTYYAGRVCFVVANWQSGDAERYKRMVAAANSFGWLTQQPSSYPHWQVDPHFLLGTLTDD